MTQKIAALDAAFLHMESYDSPMHVAGLQIFSLPPGAGTEYLRRLVAELKRSRPLAAPWNRRLKSSPLSLLAPEWEEAPVVDLDYHVRHLALPQPGGERELGVMISRLHSHLLDRRRPLWECHVIEGLENDRFALYTKMHHALVDGVTAMRLMMQSLAPNADTPFLPPWAEETRPRSRKPRLPKALGGQLSAAGQALQGLARLAKDASRGAAGPAAPFTAPHSRLNGRVTGQRRLATQVFEISRIKAVARAGNATLNDVVLALCSAALRRFLRDDGTLPVESLVASVPVSLREPGEPGEGNAVGLLLARIGTDIAEPRTRLALIGEETRRAKEHLRTMKGDALSLYSALFATPLALQAITGLAGRTRPFYNITVSNVPGPADPLFLQGARLEAMYPVSIATHGQALNITCTSYAGSLNFGLLGCRDSVPHLQRLALYLADALAELEAAFGLSGTPTDNARLARAIS